MTTITSPTKSHQTVTSAGDACIGRAGATRTESGATDIGVRKLAPSDPSQSQWMKLQQHSGAFDWDRPEEDGYSLDDGEPV